MVDTNAISMSVLRSFDTGNTILNILLGAIIASIVTYITTHFQKCWDKFIKFITPKSKYVSMQIGKKKYISKGEMFSEYIQSKDDNSKLIRAVLYYFTKNGKFEGDEGEARLNSEFEKKSNNGSIRNQALKHKIIISPISEVYVIYKEYEIFLKLQKTEEQKDGIFIIDVELTLSIKYDLPNKNGLILLRDFTDHCYKKYVKKKYPKEKTTIYYYNLKRSREENGILVYDQYSLENTKQLEHVFFDEKDTFMNLLTHFQNKTGAFSIPGAPHKLGLLLHGCPGTGKSSLIKAIANATKRSVFNISLNLIRNGSELENVLFQEEIIVYRKTPHGWLDSRLQIPLSQRIYVFEDIDAMDDIVKSRERKKKLTSIFKNSEDSSEIAIEKKDDFVSFYSKWMKNLTLSDLLRCFDGVLELNNCIIIMTTNHIQKLDPALIRPGRVTKIYMGKANRSTIKNMLQMFFPDEKIDITGIKNNILIPAMIESICQITHDANEAVQKLIECQKNLERQALEQQKIIEEYHNH